MSKNSKKVVQVQEKELVDNITGEVITTEVTKTSYIAREPPYFKMFCDDLGLIFGLNQAETKCMYELARNMSYSNVIPLVTGMRDFIRKTLGMTKRTFERTITQLKNYGVLIPMVRDDGKSVRGMYILNPEICAKGAWEDIKKLRMSIDYVNGQRYVSYHAFCDDDSVFSTKPMKVSRTSDKES